MTPPEDFKTFWLETAQEAMALPLDYTRSSQDEVTPSKFLVEKLSFRSADGRFLEGWIAFQAGALKEPGFLWIPPYGQESMLPNDYGTREGFVSLSFNFHGNPSFHQERYTTARGYFAKGAENPETWIFRTMFQDAMLAARILRDLPETSSARVGAMGMSQGGGMAVWLGAWCEVVGAVCADMPFLANIGETLHGKIYRYPQKELLDFIDELPLGLERVLNTVSYYDTIAHAHYCRVPTQVSLGLKDPASRPDHVRALYDALRAVKALRSYEVGHEWTPQMIENNRQWLLDNLR